MLASGCGVVCTSLSVGPSEGTANGMRDEEAVGVNGHGVGPLRYDEAIVRGDVARLRWCPTNWAATFNRLSVRLNTSTAGGVPADVDLPQWSDVSGATSKACGAERRVGLGETGESVVVDAGRGGAGPGVTVGAGEPELDVEFGRAPMAGEKEHTNGTLMTGLPL